MVPNYCGLIWSELSPLIDAFDNHEFKSQLRIRPKHRIQTGSKMIVINAISISPLVDYPIFAPEAAVSAQRNRDKA